MAFSSKCASCGNTGFEIKDVSPAGAGYKLKFIQCSSCGVPIGVVDHANIGAFLKTQETEIQSIELRLSQIERKLDQLIFDIRQE